jgi:tripartite-type tricarboxylate transporter receptor subunit TctC
MLIGLIGAQVDFATAALPIVQAHLKSGALKAIGAATAQRVPAAPEIPTHRYRAVHALREGLRA